MSWQPATLGELVEIRHGFAFSGEFFRDEPPGDVLLTPGNFAIGGGFSSSRLRYFDGPVPEEFVLEEGDLLITMTDLSKAADTLGYPARVPAGNGRRFLHNQRLGKVVLRPGAPVITPFLSYLLRTPSYRHEVVASATGTTVKHTSPSRIKRFRFMLPPLYEQRAIAGVLGALDDKIELNWRMNETLDDLSVSLFLEFLRRISSEGTTVRVGDELTTLLGGTPSRSRPEYWSDGTVAWINSGKTNEFRIVEPSEYITEDALASSSAKLLPARATVVAITGATLGQVSLTEIETAANQSVVGVIGSDRLPNEYVYLWFRTRIEDLVARQTGGAQQHINRRDVDDLEIVVPPCRAISEWIAVVRPLFDQIRGNSLQSRTLAELRDALLPKLISGELRVRDSEAVVEQAT